MRIFFLQVGRRASETTADLPPTSTKKEIKLTEVKLVETTQQQVRLPASSNAIKDLQIELSPTKERLLWSIGLSLEHGGHQLEPADARGIEPAAALGTAAAAALDDAQHGAPPAAAGPGRRRPHGALCVRSARHVAAGQSAAAATNYFAEVRRQSIRATPPATAATAAGPPLFLS